MKWYSDFVFWKRATLEIIKIENLQEGEEMAYAQNLAQEHGATISYAVVSEYFVEPVKCPTCGDVAPAAGPCGCSEFEEEIPFQGEPVAGPERNSKEYVGL